MSNWLLLGEKNSCGIQKRWLGKGRPTDWGNCYVVLCYFLFHYLIGHSSNAGGGV